MAKRYTKKSQGLRNKYTDMVSCYSVNSYGSRLKYPQAWLQGMQHVHSYHTQLLCTVIMQNRDRFPDFSKDIKLRPSG